MDHRNPWSPALNPYYPYGPSSHYTYPPVVVGQPPKGWTGVPLTVGPPQPRHPAVSGDNDGNGTISSQQWMRERMGRTVTPNDRTHPRKKNRRPDSIVPPSSTAEEWMANRIRQTANVRPNPSKIRKPDSIIPPSSTGEEWMANRMGRPIRPPSDQSPLRRPDDGKSIEDRTARRMDQRITAPFRSRSDSASSSPSERESLSSSSPSKRPNRRFNFNSEPSLVPDPRFQPFFDRETDGGSSFASSDSSFLGPIRRRRHVLERKNTTDSDESLDDIDDEFSAHTSSTENKSFENHRRSTFPVSRKRTGTDTLGSMKAPKIFRTGW